VGCFLVLVDRSRTGSRTAVEKKLVSVVSRDPIDTHTHSTYKVRRCGTLSGTGRSLSNWKSDSRRKKVSLSSFA